jgi:copper homeostasis protein CutC
MIDVIYRRPVTFHRAFDMTRDLDEGIYPL